MAFTGVARNTGSFTNLPRNTASFTGVTRNTGSFTNLPRNTATFSGVNRVNPFGLWSSNIEPWGLPLPWQYSGTTWSLINKS